MGKKDCLFCYLQCFVRFTGQLDENEIGLGIEIVFAGFIDHSEIALSGSLLIRDYLVDLAFLQILAILVLHAKPKPIIFFCHSLNPKSS